MAFRITFLRARSLSHSILLECLHNCEILSCERERERENQSFSYLVYMSQTCPCISFTRRDWVNHLDHPFKLFFSPSLRVGSRLEIWCVPASSGWVSRRSNLMWPWMNSPRRIWRVERGENGPFLGASGGISIRMLWDFWDISTNIHKVYNKVYIHIYTVYRYYDININISVGCSIIFPAKDVLKSHILYAAWWLDVLCNVNNKSTTIIRANLFIVKIWASDPYWDIVINPWFGIL